MTHDLESPRRYIVRRGASDGAILGLLFTAIFFCSVYSDRLPLLAVIALMMIVAVPLAAYLFLRRSFTQAHFHMALATVWLQGILLFIFGALLTTVGVYLFFRFIEPDYVSRLFDKYLALSEREAIDGTFTDTIRRMRDVKFFPRPVDMVMSTLWAISFFGSMLSLLLAPFVRRSRR